MMLLLFFIQIFLFATISSSESLLDTGKKGAETEQNGKGATKSSPFIELLGETLYKWKINADDTMEVEELSTAELLKGKTAVAIYFSASWCGPCKQFTPFLAQLYKNLQKKGKKFEVVWLSRDRSSEEFLGYYQKMPWLAVTLQNLQPVLEKIAPMFQLKGIPHLVILDGDDASLITLNGVNAVVKDQYGLEYPWRARTLMNMMPKPLKKLLKNQLNTFFKVFQGVLDGVAPKRVLAWLQVQVLHLASLAKVQIVAFINEKTGRKPSADLSNGGGSSKEENSRRKSSQGQQIQLGVAVDSSISESAESSELLVSA